MHLNSFGSLRVGIGLVCGLFSCHMLLAQTPLIGNVPGRSTQSLNGTWHYIVDPYETGYYDYRYQERKETDGEAYWNNPVPKNKTDRKEHAYVDANTLEVPGDWNSQAPEFLYYEGTVWYQRTFDVAAAQRQGQRAFLYFGAVNYQAEVYLNGRKLGSHKGGFTAFNFEIPDTLLRDADNFLVVKVDNKRAPDEVPTVNTDWWNYGGITRDVHLIWVPDTFIQNYFIQLERPADGAAPRKRKVPVAGWVKLNGAPSGGQLTVEIPELKVRESFPATGDSVAFQLTLPSVELWSPESPKRYEVRFRMGEDEVSERIGFRTIAVQGKDVLLNGQPIFMRGISVHGEIPDPGRRANSEDDAAQLLGWAHELGCNMVRLAHYPHSEQTTRLADSLGILVWSEIPVYWTIDFGNLAVLTKAKHQLHEMIARDQNRASIIIWSVGNETPVSPVRTAFMSDLAKTARAWDGSRLISAALEVHYTGGKNVIDDPLGQYTDLVSVNEYLGWYGGLPDNCRTAIWETSYDKPLFISETGAGAKAGFHADSLTRWSEEYQAWYFREQVAMMKRMPDNFVGLSPWVLVDFRSPKRNNQYQQGWNRKGLIGSDGQKKEAFSVLNAYYEEMKAQPTSRKKR
ncbi:beta-glucuronidase [Catalinimonas alkaloidigena]|uniref:Beta-glucuronidase n=1 Tax=Catalinimonas alkaloidigena TaxID=1075417 RepID=A0A1G9KLH6_9BACT|nr:glycoside hydrolase family 2 TIM barrel-domain containing protein [Catalinimonas alkaloidigena]SDL50519.1 beta-glucuronidase [Catalinimonas alkaloidigena]